MPQSKESMTGVMALETLTKCLWMCGRRDCIKCGYTVDGVCKDGGKTVGTACVLKHCLQQGKVTAG